jgi:hypothetical protein
MRHQSVEKHQRAPPALVFIHDPGAVGRCKAAQNILPRLLLCGSFFRLSSCPKMKVESRFKFRG